MMNVKTESGELVPSPGIPGLGVRNVDTAEVQVRTSGIGRSEVMRRGKSWVDAAVPYSMDPPYRDGWRRDCSGFVSMAWNESPPGLSTVTLPNVSHPISKDDLLRGDILLKGGPGTEGANGHVRIFGGWLDGNHSRYWVYEQTSPHTTYSEYMWADTAVEYPPYRYNNIVNDPTATPMRVSLTGSPGAWALFARGTGGDVVTTWQNDASGDYGPWVSLGGNLAG
jgi:hypothetical protein